MKLENILNEVDEQGNPYFDEEEKQQFLTEWQDLQEGPGIPTDFYKGGVEQNYQPITWDWISLRDDAGQTLNGMIVLDKQGNQYEIIDSLGGTFGSKLNFVLKNTVTGKTTEIKFNEITEFFFNPNTRVSKKLKANQNKQLRNENMPIFSTSKFQNVKNADLQRLLMMIKNPRERQQMEIEAERWAAKSGKPAAEYLEQYLSSTRSSSVTLAEKSAEQVHVLDLTRGKNLDESFLRQFGWMIEKVLERMFGHSSVPVSIRGSKEQITALSRALAGEKEYMTKFQQLGLDNPQTFRSKSKLQVAVDKFERATGIKWPFGDKK